MKNFILLITCMCLVIFSYAQSSKPLSPALGFTHPGNSIPSTSADIFKKPAPSKQARQGSPYLFDKWTKGAIYIKSLDKHYNFDSIRFDIMRNDVEFKMNRSIKVIRDREVQEFSITNATTGNIMQFVRLDKFDYERVPLVGFGQIVTQGEVTLVKRFYTEFKRANYNPALDLGDRFDSILQKAKYYFTHRNKIYEVKGKKDLIKFYEAQGIDVKKYLKQNKTNLKNEAQLVALVNHFNSIK